MFKINSTADMAGIENMRFEVMWRAESFIKKERVNMNSFELYYDGRGWKFKRKEALSPPSNSVWGMIAR